MSSTGIRIYTYGDESLLIFYRKTIFQIGRHNRCIIHVYFLPRSILLKAGKNVSAVPADVFSFHLSALQVQGKCEISLFSAY